MIDIMFPAFAECLVLVGIHSYLGLHVIKRKVIFVDLALAQIAALGSTFAFLFGVNPASTGGYWFSLGFTIIGAAVFSLSRIRHEKIPQEAVIGLVYAIAAAGAILVVDKAPHGAEHIKEIMTGNILWVKWESIATAATAYLLVGIFHFIYRDRFLLISHNPEMAYKKGINVRLWDFLFYVSFGVVITHSVNTAGVLLVFVFLVVPAVATIMITDRLWLQLILGWGMGTLVSMLGLYLSYVADLPSGPAVVVTYGFVLLLTALGLYVIRSINKLKALRNLGLGLLVFALALLMFRVMGTLFSPSENPHGITESEIDRHEEMHRKEVSRVHTLTETELNDILATVTDPDSLQNFYEQLENPFHRFEVAHKIYDLDRRTGSRILIHFLDFCEIPFLRQKALDILVSENGNDFGYDALKPHDYNVEPLQRWNTWWQEKYGNR